jgi:hypothetical protein
MTTLKELLAMMSEDEAKAAPETAVAADDAPLDDGPVLTGRLWPSALPRPEARRGLPPEISGLIDVRAMAEAYREDAARVDTPDPPPFLGVAGMQPVVLLRPRRPSRLARAGRAAILLALGGAAFALVTDVVRRTSPPVPAATLPLGPAMRVSADSSVAAPREPARTRGLQAQPSDELPLDTSVIELPTTITEVSGQPGSPLAGLTAMTPAPARLPLRPSNSEIANAIVDAQDHLDRCRNAFGGEGGLVPIEIEVAPSGAITSVTVGLGSTGFRACIRDGVRRQRLPASAHGTRAKFPIVVQ